MGSRPRVPYGPSMPRANSWTSWQCTLQDRRADPAAPARGAGSPRTAGPVLAAGAPVGKQQLPTGRPQTPAAWLSSPYSGCP